MGDEEPIIEQPATAREPAIRAVARANRRATIAFS
jgi:hypothetical protein